MGGDHEGLLYVLPHWRCAQDTHAEVLVLILNGLSKFADGDAHFGHTIRPQPDTHGDIRNSQHAGAVGPWNVFKLLKDIEVGVVVEEGCIVAIVRGIHHDPHDEAGRLLIHRHTLLDNCFRQLRLRLADAVLHVNLIDVGVAAGLEVHADRHVAARRTGRLVIEQIVDAVDLRLQRCRHGVGNDLGRSAGIDRLYLYLRRRHVGILLDRRNSHRYQAGENDQQRDDRGQNRPCNKEMSKH